MAYMNQEKKKKIVEKLKQVLKGTGVKYTLGVHHHSTLVMKITEGPVDFIENMIATMEQSADGRQRERAATYRKTPWTATHIEVNEYWYQEHFTGQALDLLKKIIPVLNEGNHDRSDIQSDYFDVGWYLSIKIGTWDKPYRVKA